MKKKCAHCGSEFPEFWMAGFCPTCNYAILIDNA